MVSMTRWVKIRSLVEAAHEEHCHEVAHALDWVGACIEGRAGVAPPPRDLPGPPV